jgi:hypothetical protein
MWQIIRCTTHPNSCKWSTLAVDYVSSNSFREAGNVLKKIRTSFLLAALWIILWLAHSICLSTQFHVAFSTTLALEAGNVCRVLWSGVEIASGLQTKVWNNLSPRFIVFAELSVVAQVPKKKFLSFMEPKVRWRVQWSPSLYPIMC